MKVLVCPLDWGLGHATRCIPIIRELINRSCHVAVASSGPSLALLREEFSDLAFYEITGYDPAYSSSGSFVLAIATQFPKFLAAIRREHDEVATIVNRDGFDLVISDNRYGCWSARVPSVIVTHQLNIPMPWLFSGIVNSTHHRYLKKFTYCWVPDNEGDDSLAGALSTSNGFQVIRIGLLSRFKRYPVEISYDVLGLVSGPEPQRQILEDILRDELQKSGKKTLLVRGLPGQAERKMDSDTSEINHLPSVKLNQAILESSLVISRPGYSTVMDLSALGKQAIFVPTPGQPEQEYLGKELMRRGIALCVDQDRFDLSTAMKASRNYKGFSSSSPNVLLKGALDKVL